MKERMVALEFDSVINKRTSVRKYLKKGVLAEDIKAVIDCGKRAPAACNLRALETMVITDESDKTKIVNTTYKGSIRNNNGIQSWMLSAPVFLIIYMDMDKCKKKYGEDDYKKDAYLNASASIENMLLKAVDLGMGSCYVTGFREKELTSFINIDNDKEVIAILTLGYEDKAK
ncbi:MAG TPA: hypothetical protein DC024_07210 [Clostridiales bacterium]|jgi:nitroreductase|nr:nitroreductase family protein [Tissierellia bacterium]HBC31016.1 hypothetical protein [Clostridiales bacterium]